MQNLKLQRYVFLKKEMYKKSFIRIKLFKNIKSLIPKIIDEIKIDYVKGEAFSKQVIAYRIEIREEFKVFERELKKQIKDKFQTSNIEIFHTLVTIKNGYQTEGISVYTRFD